MGNLLLQDTRIPGKTMVDKVLVVDDEVKILSFVRMSLRLSGYQVITTTSGEESLELIQSEKPDLLVLDIFMPGIDGFEVLRRLRTVSELPVIMMSSHSSASGQGLSLGASNFLAKPFRPYELVQRITALLNHRNTTN